MHSPTELIAQPDAVTLDLPAGSGEAAIRFLHARLTSLPAVKKPEIFLADLLERASVDSVCIASDIALPHARTTAVERIVLAVGRSVGPIAFDAQHPKVQLVFLVGTPKQAVAEYLQLVAGISRLLKNEKVKSGLLKASTEEEFRAVLARSVQK